MQHIKKNGSFIVFGIIALSFALGFYWTSHAQVVATPPHKSLVALAAVDAGEEPLSPVTLDGIRATLDEIQLSPTAMAALNVTESQAEQLLTSLVNWYVQNETALQTADNAVAQAQRNLYLARKAVRKGDREISLPTVRQQLLAARQARQNLVTEAKTTLQAQLSPSQQATWQYIHDGWGHSMPYAMLDLTSTQRVAMGRIAQHWFLQSAADNTQPRIQREEGEQEAADNPFNAVLTDGNRTIIQAWTEYAAQASLNVNNAFNNILLNQHDLS